MQNIRIYPGLNSNVMQALQKKVAAMPPNSNLCALVLDEMAIKESVTYNCETDSIEGLEDFGRHGSTKYVANHALVFMARGLTTHWKQAVGYYLSSGPIKSEVLKSLILDAIDNLENIGLNIKVVISDQGSGNRKAFESLLGVTDVAPQFIHADKKYVVMYDPSHLLKNTRNNLKKTGFVVHGQDIEWSHIERFYELDCRSRIRMAPRLTHKHISLPPFASLRVKFATQALSHSVAADISALVIFGLLPEEADATAEFVEKMDQLFNTFNSGSLVSNTKMRYA